MSSPGDPGGQPNAPSSNLNTKRIFQECNEGPFAVWIRPFRAPEKTPPETQNRQRQKLSPFKVGRTICEKYSDIQVIEKISNYQVEVVFKTKTDANNLLLDPFLHENGLEALIPTFRLERKGLIRGIDVDISNEEITKFSRSKYQVIDAVRMNRRNPDSNSEEKWIPSETVILTFEGQTLPFEICLHKVIVEVEPYITTPSVCFNCFKPGHVGKYCKSESKCSLCGASKHSDSCAVEVPRCANCNGGHKSTDRSCPTYVLEKEVRRAMAVYNVSMTAARRLVTHNSQAKVQVSKENFPELKPKNQPTYSAMTRIDRAKNQPRAQNKELQPQQQQREVTSANRKTQRHVSDTQVEEDRRSKKTRNHEPEKPKNYYKEQVENGQIVHNTRGSHPPRGGILNNNQRGNITLQNRYQILDNLNAAENSTGDDVSNDVEIAADTTSPQALNASASELSPNHEMNQPRKQIIDDVNGRPDQHQLDEINKQEKMDEEWS